MEHSHAEPLSGTSHVRASLGVQALWISAFGLLTAAGAQIEIPHLPVPYTLQTLFVILSGAFLGKRNGALSQLLYLCAGVIGIPVFAGFGFGLVRVLGPSGGYLLAFPVAAFTVGYLVDGKADLLRTTVAMVAGLFVIFSLGALQLNIVYYHQWSQAILQGFLIFSWWDLLKLIAAITIYQQLSRRIRAV